VLLFLLVRGRYVLKMMDYMNVTKSNSSGLQCLHGYSVVSELRVCKLFNLKLLVHYTKGPQIF
jgi:hypothetical protein